MQMKKVLCSNPSCAGRRAHYERPEVNRRHQMVEVPETFEGRAFCSIECRVYYEGYQRANKEANTNTRKA